MDRKKASQIKTVAILTLPFEPNYGWILQLWALYSFLQSKGFDVTVIDRRWNDNNPSIIKEILRFFYYNLFAHSFTSFFRKMHLSPTLRNSSSLHNYVEKKHFDVIIVGSDQVWRIENTRDADLNYFLDFTKDIQIKRIAYAASFGKDVWKGGQNETTIIKDLLNSFDLVSVREQSGVEICHQLFNIEAQHVLDPTLLLNEKDYSMLIKDTRTQYDNYIATYLLDFTQEKRQVLACIQKSFSINKIVSLYPKSISRFNNYKSIETWLRTIRDSKFVIIDSFHGMVFSIIFHKQFLVIGNKKRGLTRFISLLKSLGLENRLITDDVNPKRINSLLSSPVDYNVVESKLAILRDYSINLLCNSIG